MVWRAGLALPLLCAFPGSLVDDGRTSRSRAACARLPSTSVWRPYVRF